MATVLDNPPVALTIAAFSGASWYIGFEVGVSLLLLFKRRRGLYFWACAIQSWGVILQTLFIVLEDFGIWTNPTGSITLTYLSWAIMVIPQSWVLYSRLYLLMYNHSALRLLRIALIFSSAVLGVTTVVLGIVSQTVEPSLSYDNDIWDRFQATAFFAQETALQILYIRQTYKYLGNMTLLLRRVSYPPSSKPHKTRMMLWHLIAINVIIICLDIVLLGIRYGGLFDLQGSFKAAVYGLKLKMEFVILNKLVKSLTRRNETNEPYDHAAAPSSGSGITVTHGWGVQDLSVATKHPTRLTTRTAIRPLGSSAYSEDSQIPMVPAPVGTLGAVRGNAMEMAETEDFRRAYQVID
ncbi:hypothetical protein GGR56DRAFT_660352 [Xylariaceae sp. FL0804]|nr:hypothetical protein GGR56DRAFT_660352 [Xylariaceae sp. FL0804]